MAYFYRTAADFDATFLLIFEKAFSSKPIDNGYKLDCLTIRTFFSQPSHFYLFSILCEKARFDYRLPPQSKSPVGFDAADMLDQLVGFQTDEPFVGDVTAKAAVLDGCFQSLVVGLDKYFAPGFVEIAKVQFFVKVVFLYSAVVEQIKNQSVNEEWFKHLGQVQAQGKAPRARFV